MTCAAERSRLIGSVAGRLGTSTEPRSDPDPDGAARPAARPGDRRPADRRVRPRPGRAAPRPRVRCPGRRRGGRDGPAAAGSPAAPAIGGAAGGAFRGGARDAHEPTGEARAAGGPGAVAADRPAAGPDRSAPAGVRGVRTPGRGATRRSVGPAGTAATAGAAESIGATASIGATESTRATESTAPAEPAVTTGTGWRGRLGALARGPRSGGPRRRPAGAGRGLLRALLDRGRLAVAGGARGPRAPRRPGRPGRLGGPAPARLRGRLERSRRRRGGGALRCRVGRPLALRPGPGGPRLRPDGPDHRRLRPARLAPRLAGGGAARPDRRLRHAAPGAGGELEPAEPVRLPAAAQHGSSGARPQARLAADRPPRPGRDPVLRGALDPRRHEAFGAAPGPGDPGRLRGAVRGRPDEGGTPGRRGRGRRRREDPVRAPGSRAPDRHPGRGDPAAVRLRLLLRAAGRPGRAPVADRRHAGDSLGRRGDPGEGLARERRRGRGSSPGSGGPRRWPRSPWWRSGPSAARRPPRPPGS